MPRQAKLDDPAGAGGEGKEDIMSDGVAMRKLGYTGASHYFSLPQRPPLLVCYFPSLNGHCHFHDVILS